MYTVSIPMSKNPIYIYFIHINILKAPLLEMLLAKLTEKLGFIEGKLTLQNNYDFDYLNNN